MATRRAPAAPSPGGSSSLGDLAIRIALVACMWAILKALGATLSATVIVATLAVVFGADRLGPLVDRFRG